MLMAHTPARKSTDTPWRCSQPCRRLLGAVKALPPTLFLLCVASLRGLESGPRSLLWSGADSGTTSTRRQPYLKDAACAASNNANIGS